MSFPLKLLYAAVVTGSLFLGWKAGTPSNGHAPARPAAAAPEKKAASSALPAAKLVTAKAQEAVYSADVIKAARAYAVYADLFSVNTDGTLSPGLAAMRKVVGELQKKKIFESAGLMKAYERVEGEARTLVAYSGGPLAAAPDSRLVPSLQDKGVGHAFYTALEDLSFALHGGRHGEIAKANQARTLFMAEVKKNPALAGLQFMVELASLHMDHARKGAPITTDYKERVAEYEAKLAAVRKSLPAAAPALAKAKDTPPAKVVVTATDIPTHVNLEEQTKRILLDGSIQGAINSVKIQMGRRYGVTSVDKEYMDLVTKFAFLGREPQNPAALYDAAIATRSVLLMLTAHPQYDTLPAADRTKANRALEAAEAYHRQVRVLQTRCGSRNEIRTRGLRCGG